jgi:acetyl esterase/lipase
MKNLIAFFLLLNSLMLISCSKDDDPSANYTTLQNVYYGSDPKQTMDVYLPSSRSITSTKAIIMIHGGGWTGGDKADFNSFVDTLKKRFPDYAIYNINYRLSANPNNIFPAQELDVKAALEFIYSKGPEYQVSDKYILVGASAGGHLAMLQAYKYNSPVKPRVVVSFFGPSDLTDMYNNPAGGNPLLSISLANAVGATPTQDPAIYISSSPAAFINPSSAVPTILLHGGADPLVSASQSVAVQTRLTNAGITNQYVLYPSGGHGDWDAATYTDAFNKIQAFIQANVP